ncbi:hypothetical protein BCV69DRAFT_76341 [Microstroma glucosiphilum]|uniref:Uncharacterized protein n=1 Tax=Pseudomicrostroma glucosiphilum TaxID=1684307 RepID=A0A316TZU9_9BASI|nr:hypothetical protein BCV69DRAFT_76341 [Pseudomicrostroma glucosiphilum]PWN18510.1 hypothetical protein BCV69DRAFT_76341 [Pseudomicrostroma glucosiphilum]
MSYRCLSPRFRSITPDYAGRTSHSRPELRRVDKRCVLARANDGTLARRRRRAVQSCFAPATQLTVCATPSDLRLAR